MVTLPEVMELCDRAVNQNALHVLVENILNVVLHLSAVTGNKVLNN